MTLLVNSPKLIDISLNLANKPIEVMPSIFDAVNSSILLLMLNNKETFLFVFANELNVETLIFEE